MGFFSAQVIGKSMLPLLCNNDIVIAKSDNECSYRPGDIVIFYSADSKTTIHRIINIQNSIYYLKGDNAFRIDYVTQDKIIGKVFFVAKNGNIRFLPNPSDKFIHLANAITCLYAQNNCSISKTIKSDTYLCYLKERRKIFLKLSAANNIPFF